MPHRQQATASAGRVHRYSWDNNLDGDLPTQVADWSFFNDLNVLDEGDLVMIINDNEIVLCACYIQSGTKFVSQISRISKPVP